MSKKPDQARSARTRGSGPRMTQPESMRTRSYLYGIDKLNGFASWRLFVACAGRDREPVAALLEKDRRLVNPASGSNANSVPALSTPPARVTP